MLLFESDWKNYPTAIVDDKTRNKSFVRLAALYRSMGVKNHAFILALVNPALQGVDPHDEASLTVEQMAEIAIECKINPWYFFREVARVPAIGGTDSTVFEANRGNISLFWLFFNHITQVLIQIRQTGKSFSTDMLMTLLLNLICTNTKINLLTKDDRLRRENVTRMKAIAECLPRYLQMKNASDLNNTEEITINTLNNRYSTNVPQSSPKMADKVGRGLTTSIMHVDEAPFQPNIKIALAAALPAMNAARDKSAAEGAPYGTIFTTTAGRKDDPDGAYIYEMISEAAEWTEKFFDCKNLEELENFIRVNSRGGVVRVVSVFNHRQLGKSDAWLLRALQDTMSKGDAANRDFFNMWTSGSQTNPIPIHLLERISGSYEDVKYIEIAPQGYVTRWFIEKDEIASRMANGRFILGMDTSEAGGKDDISLVLIDIETLETVAAGTYNDTNLITFAEWVASWFVRFPNFTGVIERRSTGAVIIDYLLRSLPAHGIDPFRRLYNTIVQDYEAEPERYREILQPMGRRESNIYVRYKSSFGFATSGSGTHSRTELYSTTLHFAAERAPDRVRDRVLIDQINGLIVKNGRIDHPNGGHDDMVIGWLMGIWFLTKGINLQHYGVDMSLVMNKVNRPAVIDPFEDELDRQQAGLRNQVAKLSDRLVDEQDDFISMRLEQEIRSLTMQLVFRDNEVFSVDALIKLAKERRAENRKSRGGQQWPSTPSYGAGQSYQQSQPYQRTYGPSNAYNGAYARRY